MALQIQRDSYRTEANGGSQPAAPTKECLELIVGLNHDLAGELKSITMYTYYSAMLTGPYRRELRSLFQSEIADEQGHAQFLSDKIAALGGEPTTDARPVAHADKPREMLEHVLKAEQQAIVGYTTRLREADSFGDFGLKVVLENMIADETRHKEEVERILAGWNELNLERARNEDRWQDDGGPSKE
jgi:bacterioferritin